MNGALSVASGKVKNVWGTIVAECNMELLYITGIDKVDGYGWDDLLKVLEQNADTIENIGKVGSVIGGVASAVNGVNTILQLTGVIESTDAKLDKIKKQLEDVQASITQLDAKVSDISNLISSSNAETMLGINTVARSTASSSWNNFLSNTVTPLSNIMTKYQLKYDEQMLAWLNTADQQNSAITVYIDSSGAITVPHPNNATYGIDGKPIVSSVTCMLSEPLSGTIYNVMTKNNGRLYDGYWEDARNEADDFDMFLSKGRDSIIELRGSCRSGEWGEDHLLSDWGIRYRYNYAVYLVTEQNVGIDELVNYCDWFTWDNFTDLNAAYEILSRGNYYYNSDRTLEIGSVATTVYSPLVDENGNKVTNITLDQYMKAVELTVTKKAMGDGLAAEILTAFTNFCYTLAGMNGGSQLAADLRPLGCYYTMLSMYYNFYSEAQPNIDATRTWLGSLLYEYSLTATLAYTFSPSATVGMITNAYNVALAELSENSGEHEESLYCYSVGKTIVPHKQTVDGYGTCLKTWNGYIWRSMPTHITWMSSSQVQVLKARFDIMKKANVVQDANFATYLVNRGIVDSSAINSDGSVSNRMYILTNNLRETTFPANNSKSLTLLYKRSGDWYNVGDVCGIGDWGELDSDYFSNMKTLTGDVVDLNGKGISSFEIASKARYFEGFFYVIFALEDESYDFMNQYADVLYALMLE